MASAAPRPGPTPGQIDQSQGAVDGCRLATTCYSKAAQDMAKFDLNSTVTLPRYAKHLSLAIQGQLYRPAVMSSVIGTSFTHRFPVTQSREGKPRQGAQVWRKGRVMRAGIAQLEGCVTDPT